MNANILRLRRSQVSLFHRHWATAGLYGLSPYFSISYKAPGTLTKRPIYNKFHPHQITTMSFPPFPKITKTWHSKPYPAIDPQRPELSQKDKVVCITGGGGAIGSAIALAFAQAGAKVAALGRRKELLDGAKTKIENAVPDAKVDSVYCDIADAKSVDEAFGTVKRELGQIDVLVCCAGFVARFRPLTEAVPEQWWQSFEVNVKGAFNCVRALPAYAAPKSLLIDISTGLVHLPGVPMASAHASSNLAATKVYETFGAENPGVEVVHIQPGTIFSEMTVAAGSGHNGIDSRKYHIDAVIVVC